MHIDYQQAPQEKEKVKTPEKPAKKQGIWPFLRFVVVTGLIFGATFLTVNFTAYKTILGSMLQPEKQQQAQEILNRSTKTQVNPDQLLPTLPDKPEIQKEYPWFGFPIAPTDNRVIIPKIGKNIPLVEMSTEHMEGQNWTALEKQIQGGLENGVVHYPGTANPGEIGNVFITGHSSYYAWSKNPFNDVFALLGQLEVGDRYYVYYEGKQYTYEIYDKYEVTPDNVGVLEQPMDKKISTLMTCTPVGTTLRRLVLNAKDVTDEGRKGPVLPSIG